MRIWRTELERYIVFDLDGTLAPVGKPTGAEEVALLKKLEAKGARIVLSSGKPTFYLCGFARQLGIENPILIGENGGVLQVGVSLPPPVFKKAKLPRETREGLALLRQKLEERFPDLIWYQPNETALTPFPAYAEDFPPILKLLREYITPEMNLVIYEHPDCFDVVWASLSKGDGIRLLSETTGANPADMIAVGDWTNDYPMFRAVGYSVGIHLPEPQRATVDFPHLKDALLHLLEIL